LLEPGRQLDIRPVFGYNRHIILAFKQAGRASRPRAELTNALIRGEA